MIGSERMGDWHDQLGMINIIDDDEELHTVKGYLH